MMSHDDSDDNGKNCLSAEDNALWEETMRDVKPLKDKKSRDKSSKDTESDDLKSFVHINPQLTPRFKENQQKTTKKQGNNVDKRTKERFIKGKIPIEARLDLHGMTQDQAHRALIAFIASAYEREQRCVLVITGTGRRSAHNRSQNLEDEYDWMSPEPGVLKRRVPDWLTEPSIASMILQTAQAQRQDGGDGALYVLLRRQR